MRNGIAAAADAREKGRVIFMMAPWGIRRGVGDRAGDGFCHNEVAYALSR
jgi:hypothetical protein